MNNDRYPTYIEALDQIEVLEKALELACEEINRVEAKFGSAYIRANGYLFDYFKTEAKEMMKSEQKTNNKSSKQKTDFNNWY